MASNNIIIPIDSQLRDFKSYIDSNDRAILSARFGDGKSYFLSEFMKKYKKKYLFIPIYPVNYQVEENKDIFEYIKRDILIRLLASGEINIDDSTISNSIYLYYYLQQNKIKVSSDLLNIAPDIHLNGADISLSAFALAIKAFDKIKTKFEEYKAKFKNESEIAEESIKQEGSIYEFDVVSQLICDLIDQYRKKYNRRKVILLIEDLDRIDPAHIFRILNIFSAHFDRYNVSWNETKTKGRFYINKFKFDKIITVCHFENIKSIYHHCYGEQTDFNGYIGKFSTVIPYKYSLELGLEDYILKYIHPDLLKFPIISKSLALLIINKYKKTSSGLWGNIRHIDSNLKQGEAIRKEYIEIDEGMNICTVNTLTRLLDLLQRFDLSWNNISNLKNNAEINEIIGVCWLYAKFGNKELSIRKEKQTLIHWGLKKGGYSLNMDVKISEGVIQYIPILKLFNGSYVEDVSNLVKRQKSFIIRYFNSYLYNPDIKTIE